MTSATATSAGPSSADHRSRAHARAAGIAYLVTFLASIPAVLLLRPVLDDARFVLGQGDVTRVQVGCLLDVVNALACVATAVAVFPVVRRHGESLALGFVATRLLEASVILVGVVSLLAVVSLRQDVAGTAGAADPATLVVSGQALVAVRDWTFQLGPNMCAALNALMFATLLYRSRLVPRVIPVLGLVGAPLLLAAVVATVLGLTEQGSAWFVGAVPIAAWELAVGVWMLVKGFRPVPPPSR